MPVTTTNLIAGAGQLYVAAFGAAEPADAVTAPGVAWTNVGGTDGGVTLNVDLTWMELSVDQTVDTPGRRLTKREATIKTNLAEVTLENIKVALNGGTIASAAGTDTYEPDDDTAAMNPDYSAVLFAGPAPAGQPRRFIGRKVLQIDGVGQEYKKDGQTFLPANFATHYVSASVRPFAIMDATA